MKRDILQVVTSTDRRGAQIFGVSLGEALAGRGHSVHTVALEHGRDANGLRIPVLGTRGARTTLGALRQEIRESSAVVAHGSKTLRHAVVAAARTGVPVVYRNIGDPAYWASSEMRRLRSSFLLRQVAAIVALSPTTAQIMTTLFRVPPSRISVIPNAVPAEAFPLADKRRRADARAVLGVPADVPLVVYIGSLTREKNVAAAVRAVVALDGAHLLIVGDGPERPPLSELARGLASERVHLIGGTDQPARVLAGADVVVLPSETEGMPAVLIEAALTGVPAVATDVGGVGEVVVHGKTGLLVPPRDQSALERALREILVDPAAMGLAARAHCLQRFEMGPVATAWQELLVRLTTRDPMVR